MSSARFSNGRVNDPPFDRREPPYLSIVLTGRNDNFGGDFTERFIRALRFNHQQLARAGVTHEFVLVEWAPLAGRSFLAKVVEESCRDLVPAQLRSMIVDEAYHDAYSLNPRLTFHEFIAKNVGIRRSRGEFVLTTNTDIYLGRQVVQRLAARALDARTLYRAVRVDLCSGQYPSNDGWSVLEDPAHVEVVNHIEPPLYTNASGDFLLLDRHTYHELRGFNEVYRVAKIHIDSNFCVKTHAAGIPIVDLESPVYHVGTGTLYANHPKFAAHPELAPWGDIRWKSTIVYHNPEDWGLAGAPALPVGDGIEYLQFSWSAVPPLLALDRIVSPSAHAGRS